MDKIFINVEDQDVAVYKVYGKSNDQYAYVDSACTTKFTTSELENVFIKGAVIVVGTTTYKPVNISIASDVATVSYIKPNGTTATSADIATVKSVKDA